MDFKTSYFSEKEVNKLLFSVTANEISRARAISLAPLKNVILFRGVPNTAYVLDLKKRKYLDMTAQAWTLNSGFVNEDILYVVSKQMQYLTHVRYGYSTIPRIKLINTLATLFNFDKVALNNEGGGLAIEAAIKLSLINRENRNTFITTYRGYHGSTLTTISASNPFPSILRFEGFAKDKFKKVPFPYCYRCPFHKDPDSCAFECLESVENLINFDNNNDIAAMIIEPMQGPGGQIPAPLEYLKKLQRLLHKYEILLIFDEAQTAFGRIGKWSASEYYNVKPDIMTLTKALGGGFPLGAILATKELSGFTEAEEHTTFGSDPVLFAAALASIEVIKKMHLLERSTKMGNYIMHRLKEMMEKHSLIGDVRGVGLFIGVELVKDKKTKEPATEEAEEVIERSFKNGVIFDVSMPQIVGESFTYRNVLKIKPPLVITESDADMALTVLDESLTAIEKGR